MSLPNPQNTQSDSAPSFQDRKRQALAQERGIIDDTPPEVPDTVVLETEIDDTQDAHQPLIDDDDDLLQEDSEFEDDADGVEELQDDSEGDELSEDAAHWKAQAEQAEHLRKEMQRDYTRKTQVIAQHRKQLEQDLELNNQVLATYVENAERHLSQWDSVNWQQLQQTLDPAAYQQRVNAYRQAVALKDRALGQHQSYVSSAQEMLERQKAAEADLSKDILKSTIPDWGNELYGQLAEFATTELDFSSEEFGNITDHRVITMIYKQFASSNPEKTIRRIKRKRPRPNASRNTPQQERSSNGQFSKAEREHRENPGDRDATRNYFRMKLERERRGANRR